jgi:hypothetical protein
MNIINCTSLQLAYFTEVEGILTIMTGQRSLAEMYANEVLSEVEERAVKVSNSFYSRGFEPTGLRIVFHFAGLRLDDAIEPSRI